MNLETEIRNKVIEKFPNAILNLQNESHMHSVPENSETHFKLIIADDSFIDTPRVLRHKMVFSQLGDLMQKFHALALHCYTHEELSKLESEPESPELIEALVVHSELTKARAELVVNTIFDAMIETHRAHIYQLGRVALNCMPDATHEQT